MKLRKWSFASLLGILFTTVLPLYPAFAGRLTINGVSRVEFKEVGDEVEVTGTYEIENRGDEMAKNVFPAFSLGQWIWSGDPKDLDRDKSAVWTISAKFSKSQLGCAQPLCGTMQLPTIGVFPLLIHRHYSDLNGYRFSAADLQKVTIGTLTDEQATVARVPPLEAAMKIEGDGQEFTAEVELINLSQTPYRLLLALHAPRELQILTGPNSVELPSGGNETYHFKLKNFSGLDGSDYATLGVIQWEERGIRNTLPVSNMVKIRKIDLTHRYIWVGVAVLLVILSSLYLFVLREPQEKSVK